MFKTKYLALTLLLICLAVLLCGCAQVNFVTYHNDDGSISEYVYLTINEQKLLSYGENPEQVAIEISADCYAEAKGLLGQYQNKLTKEYNEKVLNNDEYSAYFSGVEIIQQDYNNGNYAIGLKYKNSSIYKKYYELLNNVKSSTSTKQTKKIFYTKTYYYGTANYGDYSIFNKIYGYYTNSRFNSISPQEASLTYTYSVSSRRFHSDANTIQRDSNGNYLHTWNISPDNPKQTIYFYTISANKSVWLLICIGISLLTCLTVGTIAIIKYFKAKHLQSVDKNQNLDNNIASDSN